MLVMLVSLLGLVAESLGVAHAATQTVATCDESDLRTAINSASSGDTINFSCNGDITLSNPYHPQGLDA